MTFLEELRWRGLLHQATEGAAEALNKGGVTGYIGFDPTGDSLHLGHLVQVMGLVHFQRAGHTPMALVGGGTGMIGDPSGKSAERNLISLEQVAHNAKAIQAQLEKFLDFTGPRAARMRNNADWLLSLTAVSFLRDVGKHFSVNVMLAKDSVKSRMDAGISYTEFSYMLLQAYDFAELYRREGVALQMGGSDQWGNITAGTELIRRSLGGDAHGVTLTLVTTPDGKKFGKTADGTSVWLDPQKTSAYKFYQYWINTDDKGIRQYLRMFSLRSREELTELERAIDERPEAREAQKTLGLEVTARVHGDSAAEQAELASRIVFDKKADPKSLSRHALDMLSGELPFTQIAGDDSSISVVDTLVSLGLSSSKGDARRQLSQGAVSVNGRKLGGDEVSVPRSEALDGGYFLVRKGGREIGLARV